MNINGKKHNKQKQNTTKTKHNKNKTQQTKTKQKQKKEVYKMKSKEKSDLVLSWLRENARINLTSLSRQINIPVSTLFDHIKYFEREGVYRFVTIVDFAKLGFSTRAQILIKCKQNKWKLSEYLNSHINVNNLSRINNGFDFTVDAIFKNMKDLELFLDLLEQKFKVKHNVFFIIEEIKKEKFLAKPDLLKIKRAN